MSKRLQLPNITLAAMTSVNVNATIKALKYSMREIDFGEAILITHRKPLSLLFSGIRYRHIEKIRDIDAFNYNIIYRLHEYIKTDYLLLVHYDGFVVNPKMWRDEFLHYDYIGSPWPLPTDDRAYRDIHGNICRVGNSVSIRSKRLLEYPAKTAIPFEANLGLYNEDGFICCKNRHLFEAAGMTFAPLELAVYFGHESMIPEIEGIRPFVFHKWQGTNSEYPKFHSEKPNVLMRIYRGTALFLTRIGIIKRS
jgi:hypothetical protein